LERRWHHENDHHDLGRPDRTPCRTVKKSKRRNRLDRLKVKDPEYLPNRKLSAASHVLDLLDAIRIKETQPLEIKSSKSK
jgi:hypothetical protein